MKMVECFGCMRREGALDRLKQELADIMPSLKGSRRCLEGGMRREPNSACLC